MSIKKLIAIAIIFLGFSIAWMILGGVNQGRTWEQTQQSLKRVQNAYGGPLQINPPLIYYEIIKQKKGQVNGFETVSSYTKKEFIDPSRTNVDIDLKLERKKIGNLWFPVFIAAYQGEYEYNIESVPKEFRSQPLFLLPGLHSSESVYRSIEMKINDIAVQPLSKLVANAPIELRSKMDSTSNVKVNFYYKTTGTDYILYVLAGQHEPLQETVRKDDNLRSKYASAGRLTRLDNFNVKLTADFKIYNFPDRTIPPTEREQFGEKNEFIWQFDKTVSGKNIGLIVPKEKNPGEIAARISFFAPISLLFFFVVMMIFGILDKRRLHPMHYFFLAATFLSFHLMFSYSADHISMYSAFGIASIVSCLLTFSYLVRFNEWKYATISMSFQLLYLIVFSWSFFYKSATGLGITGLIVTIVSVITLFILMQLTAKLDWKSVDVMTEDAM